MIGSRCTFLTQNPSKISLYKYWGDIHTYMATVRSSIQEEKQMYSATLGTEFGENRSFVQSHRWHAKLLAAQCFDIPSLKESLLLIFNQVSYKSEKLPLSTVSLFLHCISLLYHNHLISSFLPLYFEQRFKFLCPQIITYRWHCHFLKYYILHSEFINYNIFKERELWVFSATMLHI